GPKMSCSLRGSQRIAMIAANPREISATSRYEVLARGMDRLKEDESVVAKVLLSPEILGGMGSPIGCNHSRFPRKKHSQTHSDGHFGRCLHQAAGICVSGALGDLLGVADFHEFA